MADADMIRGPSPRPQYPQQIPNQIRPNVNPNQPGIRPPPPAGVTGPNVGLQQQQQPRPIPPPLRRMDSKGNILNTQFQGNPPPPNQQGRPSSGPQSPIRPQAPNNWQAPGSPQQQQQQQQQQQPQQPMQNRPPYPYPNQQQQGSPNRPPFQRPPGVPVQPGAPPNPAQFRPPYPQQQRPPGPPASQPIKLPMNQNNSQSPQNSYDRNKSGIDLNATSETGKRNVVNNNDDDIDLSSGRIMSGNKMGKPIDPMTQSQYGGLLDNRSNYAQNNIDSNKDADNLLNKNILNENNTSKSPVINMNSGGDRRKSISASNQPILDNKPKVPSTIDTTQKPSLPPQVGGDNTQPKPADFDRPKMQRMASRGSMQVKRKPQSTGEGDKDEIKSRPGSPDKKFGSSPTDGSQRDKESVQFIKPKSPGTLTGTNDGKSKTSSNSASEVSKKAEIDKKIPSNKDSSPTKPTRPKKGDTDSGVDETTQRKERNGPASPGSPLKSPTKIPGISRPPSTTPSNKSNKSRSASRSRNITTPEPEPVKKVPMNKIQVGHAPSPNLKLVKSKIGSLDNAAYKPGGGNVKIESKKIAISATPRIEAKNNAYIPKGGDKKIVSTKLQWSAKSKIGSLENAHHKPGGGDKKIETIKADFKDKAKPKVGSKENVKHAPRGGDIKADVESPDPNIQTHKIEIKAQSKIGSLDNVKHKPGGGDKKIFDDKEYLKNVDHPIAPTSPSQSPIPAAMTTSSGADENLNQQQS